MTTVMVSGWKEGFQKVKFTQLLQTDLGYSLSQARKMTDVVVETGTLEIPVPDRELSRLLIAMDSLGARCGAVAVAASL